MPQHIAMSWMETVDGEKTFFLALPSFKGGSHQRRTIEDVSSAISLSDGFCVQLGKLEKTGRGSQFSDEPVSFFP